MSDALLVLGTVLVVLGVALIASGLRRRDEPASTGRFVLDLREPSPVIDLTEVGQVWTATPASSSRRVR